MILHLACLALLLPLWGQHPYGTQTDWWPHADWWCFWLLLGVLCGYGLAHLTRRGG